MARAARRGRKLHGRGPARTRRGGARRPPPVGVPALAAGTPAGARRGAVARPVQLRARRSRIGSSFAGWPFALLFWPLQAVLGTVGAWNAFLLLTYVGAGLATFFWLRELDVPRAAALVGGLVFALAPYRAAQLSAGHMLAPVSLLLPLALWALERRLMLLAVAAARLDPALRTGAPGARRDPVLPPLRLPAWPHADRDLCRARRLRRRATRLCRLDPRLARVGQPLVRAGRGLLGRADGLRLARGAARARELRLPRLADAAARARRARGARPQPTPARARARSRRARSRRCSRSARTCRCTSSSGATSRGCATRASRSGSCRSPPSASQHSSPSPLARLPRAVALAALALVAVDLRAGVELFQADRGRPRQPGLRGTAGRHAPCSSCRSSCPTGRREASTSTTRSRRPAHATAATRRWRRATSTARCAS